ncbi:MAG: DUF4330 family protein [Clostridiales bacterium]|nr:DUF4330 family protein [Clostridiales bacterium]
MAEKKYRFNILDVVIIVVVIACVAGIAVRYNLADKIGLNTKQEAIVTFLAPNVRTDSAMESFVEGDLFYCKKFNAVFGELTRREDFEFAPAVRMKEDENGVMRESTLNHRSDVTGYIKVTGKYDEEKGFLVDGTNLVSPGKEYEIYSCHRSVTILVMSVELSD